MTEEQKQKLASLQTAFIVLQAKMCRAKTTTERDSAIKAAIIRLVAEPDKEVQEALLLWQARRMGHTEIRPRPVATRTCSPVAAQILNGASLRASTYPRT